MNELKITVGSCTPQTIVIGRRGTYGTQEVIFDISYLIDTYGSGVAALAIKRSQDTSAYPAVVAQEYETLTWTVSDTDTYYVGAGECQLMWYVDGGLAKTIVYPMIVMRDILTTAEDAPDAYQEWVDDLTALGAETLQNAQNAAQSASDAQDAAEMLQNVSAEATTLEPGSEATASYEDGVFSFGIPRGRDGNGGGTSDYNDLSNKPQINGHALSGNQTAAQLGLATPEDIPTVPVQSVNGKTGAVELDADDVGAYELPAGGIPASDIADGVIPEDAGDIDFDNQETYENGTVGAKLSALNQALTLKQDATSYVTVSGTTVTQTGTDNTMYLCGELAELTFTAPQTGMTAIRFSSGSTPTVVTFSGVTAWLNGFDPDEIEASKTYEINILDGVGVASWT